MSTPEPRSSTAEPPFTAQWQDWLAQNVARGCESRDLVDAMMRRGFSPEFSTHAVAVVRAMVDRVGSGVPAVVAPDYRADPIRVPRRARAPAADRVVSIGFVLENPNVALIEGLLDHTECEQLIELSRGKLRRSEVVDKQSGRFEVSAVRTSEGTYFARGESDLVGRLEARIAALLGVPAENGEPLQILHYGPGGEYLAHHDYFDPADPGSAAHLAVGGQRVATVVLYLNDVEEGGETTFPDIEMSVSARRGCAVYFEYFNQGQSCDTRCLHAGAPVIRGEKWVATKWVRQFPYRSAIQ